ncbi:hypothetical protein [Spirosoma endbachense]|uniref:Uncharacterized protein n=1 Tax=Spirosoma endbachense TaxID=2666025 RepID=A0A6P1W3G6_9BACT|nr:hypothetical protein [Spirosoma endbachense]QHV99434.1 hypothetical protein GJR95_32435 [Spirosoma endbachense]
MKRILFLLTTILVLSIAGKPVQAQPETLTSTFSAKLTTNGSWTGFWTWDPAKRVWYWTWVWIPSSPYSGYSVG